LFIPVLYGMIMYNYYKTTAVLVLVLIASR
jgi:hypothetical protein